MHSLTSNWKEFKIKELFITEKKGGKLQVPTGSYVDKKLLKDGKIPRITVTGINNGVYGYYDCIVKDKNYRIYSNFISVSFLGTVFYQKGKTSLDMKVHCLKPLNIELNDFTGLFLVTAIVKGLKNSSYSDQISSTVLPELTINLPVDEKGDPDYTYMKKYMKQILLKSKSKLKKLKKI